jgi:hypothetical protein
VKGTKGLIKMTQGMPEIEMADFRCVFLGSVHEGKFDLEWI